MLKEKKHGLQSTILTQDVDEAIITTTATSPRELVSIVGDRDTLVKIAPRRLRTILTPLKEISF